MAKIKTSELTGAALDWAAAVANGIKPEEIYISGASIYRRLRDEDGRLDGRYMTGPDLLFSRKWEAGGPIIEREGILLRALRRSGHNLDGQWLAMYDGTNTGTIVQWVKRTDWPRHYLAGSTPLVAAMRCFVASKLGAEVDLPEELL